MVLVLSIQESDNQIISGFPEYIILSTNIPSTIFYTLDGTDPNENSDIFIDRLELPTDGLKLTLKAIAISGSLTSSILEEVYFTDVSHLDRTRLLGNEGINILPPGAEIVDHLSYDTTGNPAQTTSIPFQDLEIKASTRNNRGEDIPGDTTIDFINFPIKKHLNEKKKISYLNSIDFDPRAAYIIIDGTSADQLNEQAVRIINRPYGSMDLVTKSGQRNQQLNSSGLVRYMFNPNTGIITFYYHDSVENRWIKSTQKIENKSNFQISFNSGGPPSSYVFRWIEHRTISKLY